jgi:hypothetical protein
MSVPTIARVSGVGGGLRTHDDEMDRRNAGNSGGLPLVGATPRDDARIGQRVNHRTRAAGVKGSKHAKGAEVPAALFPHRASASPPPSTFAPPSRKIDLPPVRSRLPPSS